MTNRDRLDFAELSYREVLDATKHQDDKVGRLLAAVAFLTGGALAFAKLDYLKATYRIGAHDQRVTMLFLGAFLLFDFVAITLFVMTIGTPLTFPGRPKSDSAGVSHLFFHVIANRTPDQWNADWAREDTALQQAITKELIDDTYNLAYRAAGKYRHSRIASTAFLAAILFLIPTLVLSLDTVSRTSTGTNGTAPPIGLPWTQGLRWFIAVPVALFLFVFVLWEWGDVRTYARRHQSESAREGPLLILAFSYPIFVATIIASRGVDSNEVCLGALVVAAAGLLSAVLIAVSFSERRSKEVPLLVGAAGLVIAVFAAIVTYWGHPDEQLLLGMGLAVVILVENLRPNRLPT